jgi:hypothetical protein
VHKSSAFIPLGYIPRRGDLGLYDKCVLNFWGNYQRVFHEYIFILNHVQILPIQDNGKML